MYCVYLEIRLFKKYNDREKCDKTKIGQDFYETRKKVIVRHLNPTVEDEKAFSWTVRTKTRGQKYVIRHGFILIVKSC